MARQKLMDRYVIGLELDVGEKLLFPAGQSVNEGVPSVRWGACVCGQLHFRKTDDTGRADF